MSKANTEFKLMEEEQLSVELIEAQYALKNTKGEKNAKSLLILVSGIELAGKGEAVKQLREWVDPRYLRVKADAPHPFNPKQVFWQPYARFIPAEGQIMLMFGNWYSDLLSTAMHVSKQIDDTMFDNYVEKMRAYEEDLKNNHVDVIKIWFDLSWKSLQKRLDDMEPSEVHWHKLHGLDWRNKKQYDSIQKLRQRFTDDWIMIDCEDETIRDQQFAQHILRALQHCPTHPTSSGITWQPAEIPEVLLNPVSEAVADDEYKAELKKLTKKVADALRFDNRNVSIVFEGMDAAGKGGAIKRIVKKLDPREYEIYTIGAPEKYELRRPYQWRFWSKIQPSEKITIFDRTWYGRVMVERLEGFCSENDWKRAYNEMNEFEKELKDWGAVIIKFWVQIDKDTQLERFQERQNNPEKQWKITDEDWRNREKWDAYEVAVNEMLQKTNTSFAPWHVLESVDKKYARIKALRIVISEIEKALKEN